MKAIFVHKRPVALGTAVADEDELRPPSPQIRLHAGEVGRDLPAEAALGTPVDEEDARLEILEPDLLTVEIRQPEGREDDREWEAAAGRIGRGLLETARSPFERLDPEQQPPLLPERLDEEPGERHHPKQESSKQHPRHDGHTQTPLPEVRVIRAHRL